MDKEHVLITGGAGYIGARLVPALLAKGYKVTVVDTLQYKEPSLLQFCNNEDFEFVRGDASDESTMKALVRSADAVIPLAAVVGAPACKMIPGYAKSINFDAVRMLVGMMSKDQKIVYPTTNSGYGIGEKDAYCTEKSPLNPLSLYGRTKADAEAEVLGRVNGLSFRLATVFGTSPRMRWDLLVNDFTLRAVQDRCLVLFEADFRRNYIHVEDVCSTFIYGLENYDRLRGECFNLGLSSANLTKRQLAEKIKEIVADIVVIESPIGTDPDKRDYLVSNEKLESTGWRPAVSIEQGIRELVKAAKFVPAKAGSNV